MGGPPPNMMPFQVTIKRPLYCSVFLFSVFPQPRNPHDDRLVMSKHSIIYPKEGEVSTKHSSKLTIGNGLFISWRQWMELSMTSKKHSKAFLTTY